MARKRSDQFEEKLRELLESYEAPYDPQGWEKMEQRLDRELGKGKGKNPSNTFYAAIIGGIMLVGGAIAWYTLGHDEQQGLQKENRRETTYTETNDPSAPATTHQEQTTGKEQVFEQPSSANTSSDNTKRPKEPAEEQKTITTTQKDRKSPGKVPDDRSISGEKQNESRITGKHPEQQGNKEQALDFEAAFKASAQEGCPGDLFEFHPTGLDKVSDKNALEYHWEFGDGTTSNEEQPRHTYSKAGSYKVSLTIIGPYNTRKRSLRNMIRIHPKPTARISWNVERDEMIPEVRFEAATHHVQEVKWDFGNGSDPAYGLSATHQFPHRGPHKVRAFLSNDKGCTNTVIENVKMEHSYKLFAPNAFSPNGDGKNDVFLPPALEKDLSDNFLRMTILDRTGEVIFETTSPDEPWNGMIGNSGQEAKTGSIYRWVVILRNTQGEEETYQGNIKVTR